MEPARRAGARVQTKRGSGSVSAVAPIRPMPNTAQRRSRPRRRGCLRIGVNDIVHTVLVPTLVGITRREAPNILLEFVLQDSDRGSESLKAGEIDLALLPHFALDDNLGSKKVWTETFAIIMSRSHPLANQERLTKDDLRELSFVATSHVKRVRSFIDDIFKKNGIERKIACYVADTENLYPLVSVSDIVAVVGIHTGEQYNTDGNLVLFETLFPLPTVDVHVAWTREADVDEGHKWIRDHVTEIIGSAFRVHDKTKPPRANL